MNETKTPRNGLLWDTQWMNIVNHANCWEDFSKEDAVHEAVKMTEQCILANLDETLRVQFERGFAASSGLVTKQQEMIHSLQSKLMLFSLDTGIDK